MNQSWLLLHKCKLGGFRYKKDGDGTRETGRRSGKGWANEETAIRHQNGKGDIRRRRVRG